MNKWLTYFLLIVAGAVIGFGGLPGLVIGMAILLYLAITMTILPRLQAGEEKLRTLEKLLPPADGIEEEEFSFRLPDPAEQGWDRCRVYPSRKRYERQHCFGGPPTHNETWEYDVKGSQVFHRLIDANEEGFTDPVFEVINGTISEAGVAGNLEIRAKEIQWHECRKSERFEILAIHLRSRPSELRQILAKQQKELTAGFQEMEQKLLALGAIEKDYGDFSCFIAPDGADEDVKKQIADIQSDKQPKSMYSDSSRITSVEFGSRKVILATLNRLLSPEGEAAAVGA
jgi:hypothetical protein